MNLSIREKPENMIRYIIDYQVIYEEKHEKQQMEEGTAIIEVPEDQIVKMIW